MNSALSAAATHAKWGLTRSRAAHATVDETFMTSSSWLALEGDECSSSSSLSRVCFGSFRSF